MSDVLKNVHLRIIIAKKVQIKLTQLKKLYGNFDYNFIILLSVFYLSAKSRLI